MTLLDTSLANTLYSTTVHATGDGRNGHVSSDDGNIDMSVLMPKELGGAGGATNPEQLFAAGYAACFHSALRLVAGQEGIDTTDSAVSATVHLGSTNTGGFGLGVELDVSLPNATPRAGSARGRPCPRGVPLLERHAQQHRRRAQRRLNTRGPQPPRPWRSRPVVASCSRRRVRGGDRGAGIGHADLPQLSAGGFIGVGRPPARCPDVPRRGGERLSGRGRRTARPELHRRDRSARSDARMLYS